MNASSIFQPGVNCWRRSPASRAAVLVDAKDYFQAVAFAAERAERSLCLLAWDIDSRISLLRPEVGAGGAAAQPLSEFFKSLLARKPNLHVYILAWDFPFLFAGERQAKRETKRAFAGHPRLHFRFDPGGPHLISQHQKVIVVDDELAFCGGLDVTQQRWDTSAHEVKSSLRQDPEGTPYEPFHDVQLMVEGPAARDLGRLFRERWNRRARSFPIPPVDESAPFRGALWPEVAPLFREQTVAIARTEPALPRAKGVAESARLFADSIRRARRYIFVENQYFASRRVGELLAESLRAEKGPEIVILVRLQDSDWKEGLMGVLRARLVRKLKAEDKHGRLLVLCPFASVKKKKALNLHSKVFIADDEFLRIGSSNLCGRSEGMDYECDLALEANGAEDRRAVRSVRDRLLAEHFGVDAAAAEATLAEAPGFLAGVRALQNRSDRTLLACPEKPNFLLDFFGPSTALVDPESPRQFAGGVLRALFILALLGAAALTYPYWRPYFQQETVRPLVEWTQSQPFAYLWLTLLFAALASIAFPLLPLAVLFSLLLPPWPTFFCLLGGALTSALVVYGSARLLSRRQADGWAARLFASERWARVRKILDREGFWPIVLLRLLPLAPYFFVNLAMGFFGIPLRRFLGATFLSLLPGFILIAFLEDQVSSRGGYGSAVLVITVALALLGWGLQKGAHYFGQSRGIHAHDR